MPVFSREVETAIPIHLSTKAGWRALAPTLPGIGTAFLSSVGFKAKAGQIGLAPGADGRLGFVAFGIAEADSPTHDPLLPGKLATALPGGTYRFASAFPGHDLAALSWLLSAYRFARYKPAKREPARLCPPDGVDAERIERVVAGVAFARDLVNTPANELGPDGLEAAAQELARSYGAAVRTVRGETLAREFPLIQAVGQAAHEAPRLLDLTWGRADAASVTLVGKGVTFDTGGLDIKPEAGMAMMKKDMAGAATALGVARMVMDAKLDLRLRVVLPIVENAISAPSFRPGDVYRSRKGITVEIGNTDAEGRLILADALALACEEKPGLLLDFATLTGAARVALGPDLPAFFTDDDGLAEAVIRCGRAAHDPVWRMPLWPPYAATLDGKTAELGNVAGNAFAGSVVAALFLQRFVEPGTSWGHFDVFGWNQTTKPGRPEGGEAQTARLVFDLLSERAGARA